jgi:hypothetical protein
MAESGELQKAADAHAAFALPGDPPGGEAAAAAAAAAALTYLRLEDLTLHWVDTLVALQQVGGSSTPNESADVVCSSSDCE